MKKNKTAFLIIAVSVIAAAIIIITVSGNKLHTKIPQKLDNAVTELIFKDNENNIGNNDCKTEGHEIFCYEITENKVKVYGYVSYTELNFMNGYLCYFNGSGMSCPFVAEFDMQDGKYSNGVMHYPEDGEHYPSSIKEMFPKIYEFKALNYDNWDYIREQKEKYAEKYLETVGFRCDIALHPDDFDVKLIPASDSLPDGNSGHSVNYPFWLGTQMFYENGKWMVYAQFYNEKEQKAYLTVYENGSTKAEAEVYALDGQNATYIGKETIDVYPFFDDKNLESINSLPDTQETTSAITIN